MSKVQKNEFEISGKVIYVGLPVSLSDKFSKRVIVMEGWVGRYRKELPFDFINDNMGLLDGIYSDDWVTISFQLTGKKKVTKEGKASWYGNIEGIGIVKHD